MVSKFEAWKAWHESIGIGMEATEHALEKGSHGKAFSYAWDAAVKAEREACAKLCEDYTDRYAGSEDEGHGYEIAAAIRARGEE